MSSTEVPAAAQKATKTGVFEAALAAVDKYIANPESRCASKVLHSMEIINEALGRYSPGEVSLSFNGGKDCQVMLIILLAVCWKRNYTFESFPAVYVKESDSFPEVDKFVQECGHIYQLQVDTVEKSMKDALAQYLNSHKQVKAVFVGIRRQDPYGEFLKPFQKTDHGWPDFERIHPILEWDYGDIWDFLIRSRIAYCALYDLGYTSLGGVSTTIPNPDLKKPDGTYESAWLLKDFTKERAGRTHKS